MQHVLFYIEDGRAQEQAAQKVMESPSGDIQTPPGHIPVSPAPDDPTLAGGLDWMISRGPSNPNNSVKKNETKQPPHNYADIRGTHKDHCWLGIASQTGYLC